MGLGIKVLRFTVKGLGIKICGLRVWGLRCRFFWV